MKHFCVICWEKWFCGVGKPKKGEKRKPMHIGTRSYRCTGRFMTMCDNCLTNIPLRYYKDLPPRGYLRWEKKQHVGQENKKIGKEKEMKTIVTGKVWLVLFKDRIEAVCTDTTSCLRFQSQWYADRGLSPKDGDFRFIVRDILKLKLK